MRNMRVFKRNILIFALSSITLTALLHRREEKDPYYVVTLEEEAFGDYSNGSVYIGDKEYLESLEGLDRNNDVLVLDERDSEDPCMKIINSYVVDDEEQMKGIIALLCEYEELYPSDWERTEDSLYREWLVHNICHNFHYQLNRTTDVDLNNADESLYKKLVFRILD